MSTFRIVAPLPSNQDVTSPHDDPLMPIFSSHIRSFDTKIMMEYVISGIDANKAAKLWPSRPAVNFIFVPIFWKTGRTHCLTISGVWRPNGTKTLCYTRDIDNSGEMKVKHWPKEATDLRAKRYLYVHSIQPLPLSRGLWLNSMKISPHFFL